MMTPLPNIEEISEAIKNLPSKEILIYLVTKGIFDYSKEGFDKIKKLFKINIMKENMHLFQTKNKLIC